MKKAIFCLLLLTVLAGCGGVTESNIPVSATSSSMQQSSALYGYEFPKPLWFGGGTEERHFRVQQSNH